jgi:hypothetical protein
MRFAIMEYSDRGADFVRLQGLIANFSYGEARRVMKKLSEATGNGYSAIAIDGYNEPTMAADVSMF